MHIRRIKMLYLMAVLERSLVHLLTRWGECVACKKPGSVTTVLVACSCMGMRPICPEREPSIASELSGFLKMLPALS